MNHKFELGMKIRDKVTGMEGITKSRIEYLNGCWQYSIQPPYDKKNSKYPESFWFDQDQLEFVSKGVFVEKNYSGGPEVKCP